MNDSPGVHVKSESRGGATESIFASAVRSIEIQRRLRRDDGVPSLVERHDGNIAHSGERTLISSGISSKRRLVRATRCSRPLTSAVSVSPTRTHLLLIQRRTAFDFQTAAAVTHRSASAQPVGVRYRSRNALAHSALDSSSTLNTSSSSVRASNVVGLLASSVARYSRAASRQRSLISG
jgi:hypothetical protein